MRQFIVEEVENHPAYYTVGGNPRAYTEAEVIHKLSEWFKEDNIEEQKPESSNSCDSYTSIATPTYRDATSPNPYSPTIPDENTGAPSNSPFIHSDTEESDREEEPSTSKLIDSETESSDSGQTEDSETSSEAEEDREQPAEEEGRKVNRQKAEIASFTEWEHQLNVSRTLLQRKINKCLEEIEHAAIANFGQCIPREGIEELLKSGKEETKIWQEKLAIKAREQKGKELEQHRKRIEEAIRKTKEKILAKKTEETRQDGGSRLYQQILSFIIQWENNVSVPAYRIIVARGTNHSHSEATVHVKSVSAVVEQVLTETCLAIKAPTLLTELKTTIDREKARTGRKRRWEQAQGQAQRIPEHTLKLGLLPRAVYEED